MSVRSRVLAIVCDRAGQWVPLRDVVTQWEHEGGCSNDPWFVVLMALHALKKRGLIAAEQRDGTSFWRAAPTPTAGQLLDAYEDGKAKFKPAKSARSAWARVFNAVSDADSIVLFGDTEQARAAVVLVGVAVLRFLVDVPPSPAAGEAPQAKGDRDGRDSR